MWDCSQWVLCMSESLSACVHVLAELQWPGGNGPAEYPGLTLILFPQASPTPTHADICYALLSQHIILPDRIEGHLQHRHVRLQAGKKQNKTNCAAVSECWVILIVLTVCSKHKGDITEKPPEHRYSSRVQIFKHNFTFTMTNSDSLLIHYEAISQDRWPIYHRLRSFF